MAPAPTIVTHRERPDFDDRWDETVRPVWPEFLLHDAVVNESWWRLFEVFPDFQFYLYDEGDDAVLGVGNAIPFAWDGAAETLPAGVDGVLALGVRQREDSVPPNTLSALQAVVSQGSRGQGLSGVIIGAMRDVAVTRGFRDLVAPVRPTLKHSYPITPMERYLRWEQVDGLPFDPWFRLHRRLGAEFVAIAPASMAVTGTVAEWEDWTGMAFPDSGEYVARALSYPW